LIAETKPEAINLANWTKLAQLGSTTAVSGLSQMVNKDFSITALKIEEVSKRNATGLLGKADSSAVGIYLKFDGHSAGQILLAFDPETAYELVDMALGLTTGSTQSLGEMERSVLGEMGNIVGGFFLNSVADCLGSRLMPSPPVVVQGPSAAMMGAVLAKTGNTNDSLFVIKLVFRSAPKTVEGSFLVLPAFAG
jgi:chemotaxis protein CheC